MNPWHGYPVPALRHEALYGDRVVPCFAERPKSLHALFANSLTRRPSAQALVFEGQRWTYAQCEAISARLAAGLAAQGVSRGERVVMFIDNRPEFFFTLLALARLGAIAVPVGVREQRPGLAYIARQCGAMALIAEAALAERVPDASDAPELRLRMVVGAATGFMSLDALMHGDAQAPPVADVPETGVAVILYTSGTTGKPKGAMLAHCNIIHSAMVFESCLKLTEADRDRKSVV